MHRIDYTEIFVPTIRRKSLKIFLAIARMLRMELLQINVIGAYLESLLRQGNYLIYMKIPQRYKIGQKSLVYKIFRSLYGLKQAGKLWNKTLIKFFWKIGILATNTDLYILAYWKRGVFIIIKVYVNNLTLASQSQNGPNWLKDQLI